MLYQSSDKVEQYLSHYNIQSVSFSKDTQNIRFNVKNIHTDKIYKIESEFPLYNVQSKIDTQFYNFSEKKLVIHDEELRRITFSDPAIMSWYNNTYLQSEYYKRYHTLKHTEPNKQSTEHFTYLELHDIEKLKNLSGILEDDVVDVFGHFVKLTDDTLRLIVNPKVPVLEDVDEVFMTDFFMFSRYGQAYPIYHIIYTKKGSNDVYLEYTNFLTNSINNRGVVTVNLTDIFDGVQDTVYNDFKTLNGYNSKWFLVNNIFSVGIFVNTPKGIARYIPVILDTNFFNIAFNKINVNGNGVENYGIDKTPKNILTILNEKRLIPQTDMENIDLLNQLLHLSSTAEYFNDVLFSLNDSEFQFPVYLVKKVEDLETDYHYDGQD